MKVNLTLSLDLEVVQLLKNKKNYSKFANDAIKKCLK